MADVKKPRDLLEYVIVHEMVHLLEPTYSERFVALMTKQSRMAGSSCGAE